LRGVVGGSGIYLAVLCLPKTRYPLRRLRLRAFFDSLQPCRPSSSPCSTRSNSWSAHAPRCTWKSSRSDTSWPSCIVRDGKRGGGMISGAAIHTSSARTPAATRRFTRHWTVLCAKTVWNVAGGAMLSPWQRSAAPDAPHTRTVPRCSPRTSRRASTSAWIAYRRKPLSSQRC
jgi:hypothetical protein